MISPLLRHSFLLSSSTVFMFSIQTASTGPSNMYHRLSSFVDDAPIRISAGRMPSVLQTPARPKVAFSLRRYTAVDDGILPSTTIYRRRRRYTAVDDDILLSTTIYCRRRRYVAVDDDIPPSTTIYCHRRRFIAVDDDILPSTKIYSHWRRYTAVDDDISPQRERYLTL